MCLHFNLSAFLFSLRILKDASIFNSSGILLLIWFSHPILSHLKSSNNPLWDQSDSPLVSLAGRRKVTFLLAKVLPSRVSTIFHVQCLALNKNYQPRKETRQNDQEPRQKTNPQ